MTSPAPEPVVVKASVAPELWAQSGRVAALFAFGMLVKHFIDSETLMGPLMAYSGVVASLGAGLAVWAWGVFKKLRDHRLLTGLVAQVSDDIAKLR